jgi:hypothetical protein
MLGKRSIEKLRPLLEGHGPDSKGEWAMHCPYHGDNRRSASVNINTEEWNCMGCDEGGSVRILMKDSGNWEVPDGATRSKSSGKPKEEITEAKIDGWASALLGNKTALEALKKKRGLTSETVKRYQLGWDGRVYAIPVRNIHGEIVNVRRYDINVGPDSDRRKIWSVEGMGTPSLFPMDQLDYEALLICEGEFDALVAIQNGIPAITRTGTADHWKREWGQLFRGKRVFVCHDMDTKGQEANSKIVAGLRGKTKSTTVVHLPYEITAKHGKDLSDFFVEDGYTKKDFTELLRQGKTYRSIEESSQPGSTEIVPVSVMDSFDASLSERPLSMQVTITGKRIPPYSVPKVVEFTCDRQGKSKCQSCSMEESGYLKHTFPPESADILTMIGVTTGALEKNIKTALAISPQCPRPSFNSLEKRTVEEIYVRPSIENQSGSQDQDFTHRKVISTVSHDLDSNQTVDLVGTNRPDPNRQTNEFQAWSVTKPTNTLESFTLTPEIRERLEQFVDEGDPTGKLNDIADDLAVQVTKIYGRPEMHVFMDLVLHSGLRFDFGEKKNEKAWIDGLIVGDTRTGKSEAAAQLLAEYGMGEMISCESVSYAGVVGGLDRTPDGQWIIKWGVIPVNNMRAVVLDEVSGLQPHEISQMTNIRTEGQVIMQKIESGRAWAQTRLLWLANPRDARMSDYTYGVSAIQKLVGNREDMSRFDMAMGAFSEDVGSEIINVQRAKLPTRRYDQDSMQNLLRWAWTRKPHQIIFTPSAVNKGLDIATELGDIYHDEPPLVENANVSLKLARVATAIAMRTFSCDARGRCVVRPRHMQAAEDFLNKIYGMKLFGYRTLSDQRREDKESAERNMQEITEYIRGKPALLRFLKETPVFERRSLETVMNVTRDISGQMINRLWDMKAVSMAGGQLKLEPEVLTHVREIKL